LFSFLINNLYDGLNSLILFDADSKNNKSVNYL